MHAFWPNIFTFFRWEMLQFGWIKNIQLIVWHRGHTVRAVIFNIDTEPTVLPLGRTSSDEELKHVGCFYLHVLWPLDFTTDIVKWVGKYWRWSSKFKKSTHGVYQSLGPTTVKWISFCQWVTILLKAACAEYWNSSFIKRIFILLLKMDFCVM